MSIQVMALVWDKYPGDGGSELLALLALADWSDDEGCCWPSMAKVARKIRLSEKQARRVVHALIEAGIVEVTGHHQGGRQGKVGKGYSRQYRINVGMLSTLPSVSSTLPSVSSTLPPVSLKASHGRETTHHRTINRTVKPLCADGALNGTDPLPDWLIQGHWEAYVGHYHDLQASHGKPVPPAWEAKALRILSGLIDDGHDQTEVIEQAVNSRHGLLLPTRNQQPKEHPL